MKTRTKEASKKSETEKEERGFYDKTKLLGRLRINYVK